MKNLVRSKEEQLRKQEPEIAKKTHEKLEQFFSQTPKDFTNNSLHEVSFAGRPRGPTIHAQIQFVNECCTSAAR